MDAVNRPLGAERRTLDAGLVPVLLLSIALRLVNPTKVAAEDRVEYRYEDYTEDDHRIHVRTHSVGFEKEITSKITARGLLIYDGISGATPTGESAPLGSNQLPLAHMEDIRRAATLGLSAKYADRHTTSPSITYSEESDYISRGIGLTHSIDFNQKNTTLIFGAAHNFDSVAGGALQQNYERKDSTDILIGINQILTPTTVLGANLTFGYSDGFLNDPYRSISFYMPDAPDLLNDPGNFVPRTESRPRHRFRQVGLLTLTQGIKPLDASFEAEYRLYHDDWGIIANTVSLTWFQRITKYFTLAPTVRYYRQTAADFYMPYVRGVRFDQYSGGTEAAFDASNGVFIGFAGDPGYPAPNDPTATFLNVPAWPNYYSSDYRLAELEAWTFGVSGQVRIADRVTIDVAYKRYEMHGLDHITPQSAFPKADVYTIGMGIWF